MVAIVANRMTFCGKGPFQIVAPANGSFQRDLYWNGERWVVAGSVKNFATLDEVRDEMDWIENAGLAT